MKTTLYLMLFILTVRTGAAQPAFVTMTGNNDHISVQDDPFWDLPGNFTISLKVNFITTAGWHMWLTHHDGTMPQGFEFSYTGSVIRLSPEGFTSAIDVPWSPSSGTWYHIVLTRDGNTMRVFVDGVQIGTSTFSGVIGSDDFPLMIGNYYYPGYATIGHLDEVSIWHIAASQSFVNNVLSNPLTGNEPGLIGYWDMNRSGAGAGLTVENKAVATGNALDGITVGTDVTPYFTQQETPPPPAAVPLSNWSLLISALLMVSFVLLMFKVTHHR